MTVERLQAELARGVRELADRQAFVREEHPAGLLEQLPYVVKVGVSGDVAEAEDLAGALAAARALIDDALPAAGFDLRSTRLSVIVTRLGMYDGAATLMAQRGQVSR